jgi:iron complex transport system substrate-binding protein
MLALSGCTPPVAQPEAEPAAMGPVTVTDSRGQEVEVVAQVERIVSLAPSNTEILFALGLGDKVVGVTNFCDYPEEAASVEKVGDAMAMNVEKIVSLTPDLVVTISGGDEVVAKLEEADIAVVVLQPTDLDTIYETIDVIGRAAGADEAAQALVASMRQRVDAVAAKVKEAGESPKVFYELDGTDAAKPWTAGPGSWHDQFIQLVGGENVAGSTDMAWVQLSAEEIIAQDPAIIVLGDAAYGMTAEMVAERPGWDVISAVGNGAIFPIDDNLISRPGPRVVEGIEALAAIIHPDLFE